MWRYLFALSLLLPVPASAQSADSATIGEVRAAILRYDEALRKADLATLEQFWATEYTFVNPRGERLTRADRIANVKSRRTAFDSLAPVPDEERIRTYGGKDPTAVHTTLLSIGGRYSGRAERGQYRAMAIWVRRDGRWQQVASQLTAVGGP